MILTVEAGPTEIPLAPPDLSKAKHQADRGQSLSVVSCCSLRLEVVVPHPLSSKQKPQRKAESTVNTKIKFAHSLKTNKGPSSTQFAFVPTQKLKALEMLSFGLGS